MHLDFDKIIFYISDTEKNIYFAKRDENYLTRSFHSNISRPNKIFLQQIYFDKNQILI